ncbi:MAG TPA: hypothetical protein ENK18_06795 [Deltaproteobacteria bacterium]|nr:hypothetical protein [Deltaproteobacteria bacterium]
MWLLIVVVFAAMVAYAAFATWQGRLMSLALSSTRCAACEVDLEPLTGGPGGHAGAHPPRSYEVFGCPCCATLITTLHGSRSLYAYCPACRQLSLQLQVDAERPAPVGQRPRARVHERCGICGFEATATLPEVDESNVILFPGR